MTDSAVLSRRRFVMLSLIASGGLYMFSGCTNPIPSRWRYLSAEEVSLLDAIVEQIIPTDEWPGAKETGATNFIDKQLIGPYTRFQEIYRKGLKALQEYSLVTCQKKFETLNWDDQTRILEMLEEGKMEGEAWKDGFGHQFFNLLRDHTMQSFYGSPRHGGNKGNISYKMLKLDYPLIIGQNRYNS